MHISTSLGWMTFPKWAISPSVHPGHNVTIYMEQYGEAINIGSGIKQWYINITSKLSK